MIRKSNKSGKIGIIHPHLIESGGSEAVALYIAEALKKKYEVILLTAYAAPLEQLNRYYGTSLTSDEVKIIEHPYSIFLRRIKAFDAIQGALFSRFYKKFSDTFDLLISAYNKVHCMNKCIEFVADFSFNDKLRRKYNPPMKGIKALIYGGNFLRKTYLLISRILGGGSKYHFSKKLTVSNSKWTAKIMKEQLGINCRVIYPPVIGEFPEIPWNEKEDGFVYIGRLIPKKGIDFIIKVLEKVRIKGWNIHLHIIGPLENTHYVKYLKNLVKKKGKWIKLEGAKYNEEKQYFLARHKYGISAHTNEPFGISVAEMVKAGCIVWVPDGGGQIEIVNHPDLIFVEIDDAVDKIIAILKDDKKQRILRTHLAKQAEKFTVDKFKKEVKKLVKNYFKNEL